MHRSWNTKIPKQLAKPAGTSPNDTSVDPFILDFGTSVNVNEDLRRTIRTEIQELDDQIVASNASTKQEEMVGCQLRKDLSHGDREMLNLSRGAVDQLDNARVHSKFLSGFGETLRKELVIPSSSGDYAGNGTAKGEIAPSEGVKKPLANKDIFKEKSDKFKMLIGRIKQASADVERNLKEQKALTDKTKAIKEAIESDSLDSMLEEKRRETELKATDAQKEAQRKDSIKVSIQKIRARTGNHAQGVADKNKEYNAMRRRYAEVEKELSEQASTEQEKCAAKEKARDEELALVTLCDSKLKQCEKETEVYDDFCRSRDKTKAELKNLEKEHSENLRIKEELELQIRKSKAALHESKQELKVAESLDAEAKSLKKFNDSMEVSIVIPGKEEMTRLAEKKEEYAKAIGQEHHDSSVAQTREREELASKNEEKRLQTEELSALEEELEGKRLKGQHYVRVKEESIGNWEHEISEHQSLEAKYRLAYQAEKAQIEETHRVRQLELEAQVEKAQAELESQRFKDERHLHILLYGAEIIEKALEKERKLYEDPVCF